MSSQSNCLCAPSGVPEVGVFRLREFARAERTHRAQDDTETLGVLRVQFACNRHDSLE
jgi:hypothetical protein